MTMQNNMVEPACSADIGDLVAAVAQVMGEFRGVEKSGVNTFHKYKYASDADLLWTLKPLLAKHGLGFFLVDWTLVSEREVKTRQGAVERLIDLSVRYRLAHKSGQWVTITAPGSGQDPGDKAHYKAMTGALKYALRQSFAVPTGDDPERDEDVRQPRGSAGAVVAAAPVEWDRDSVLGAFSALDAAWTPDRVAELVGLTSAEQLTVAHRDRLKNMYKSARAGELKPTNNQGSN
jgi:hypothetical protein